MLPLFPKWLRHCLLCIGWWGVFGFLAKLGSNDSSPSNLQVLFTVGMVPLILVVLVRSKLRVETDRRGIAYGVLNGILAGLGSLAYFAAMSRGQASIVGPVTSLFPLVTVVLALLLLKERINRLQGIGIILALVAIGLLSA